MKIIGREHEQTELQRLFDSGNPEFVMIYGRRRVGKTFLVRETLGKDFCFAMTGLAKQKREAELLSNRMDVLLQSFKSRRTIEAVLITNQKAVRNIHYNGLINKNITLDNLIDS